MSLPKLMDKVACQAHMGATAFDGDGEPPVLEGTEVVFVLATAPSLGSLLNPHYRNPFPGCRLL